MGLLSKSSTEEDLADTLIKEHENFLKEFLSGSAIKDLRNTLVSIAKTAGTDEARGYMNYVLDRMNFVRNRNVEYKLESALADKVSKYYITESLNKSERISSKFQASSNMKLDTIIEQNDRIIALLEEILRKPY